MGQHRQPSVRALFAIEATATLVVLGMILAAILVVGLPRRSAPRVPPLATAPSHPSDPTPSGAPSQQPSEAPSATPPMMPSVNPVNRTSPVRATKRPPATKAPTTGCVRVTHQQNTRWPGGFQEQFFVANCGTTTINGWTVTVRFSGDVTIQVWNAERTGGSSTVVPFAALDYDRVIAPGANVTFGFNATYSGADRFITGCAISGGTCG